MSHPPAITISRSLGSGGAQIGVLVARGLGWRFCDRRILREAARSLGLSVEALQGQEERPCGWFKHLLNLTAFASPEVPFVPPFETPIYSSELFAVEQEVMRRLADAAPSVLIGRGGFVALKDRPATLHVRIQAGLEHRVRQLVAQGKMPDPEAARRAIEVSDRDRAAFFKRVLGLDWNDLSGFHLVLDTDRLDRQACVQAILAEARTRFDLR